MRFQHYEVLRRDDGSLFELGRGAMGITYKAFDTNLRTAVALKVINQSYLNSEVARQRFLREARAAAAIRHPNVATVFHLGNEGDAYFYAMEFIDGETVEAYMQREGAVPTLMALKIAEQVARALGAAEKQGLVHRDIKPSNLMLVREDGDDEFTVKVIDFGLAKAADREGADTATLTMGGFLGTPHFASPEQLEERELDIRSDIYSLGITLYYMLAGRTPFTGSLAQVMSQHLHREPPMELLADQPPQVIALLERMMEKDENARPQTPLELRREIEECAAAVSAAHSGSQGGRPAAGDPDTETLIEEDRESSAVVPAPGVKLADRFELLEEFRESEHGRTFKARNLEDGRIVAVLILNAELLPTSEACTRLENEVNALQSVKHPSVIRVESLERAHHLSWIVREWVEGTSLLEMIRTRGQLSAPHAIEILTALAGGLEAVQKTGVPCPELSLHWIKLVDDPVTGATIPRFNPLNFSAVAPPDPDATLVATPSTMLRASGAFSGNATAEYVFALAVVAYQLLGGMHTANPAESFVPIAGLPEEANLVLRTALNPRESHPSPVAFIAKLDDAVGATVSREPARRPPSFPTFAGDAPPPRRAPWLLLGGSVACLLLMAAIAALVVLPRLRQAIDAGNQASATPAPTPVVEPTPEPPQPTPTPEDPATIALRTGLQRAQDRSLTGDYAGALRILGDLHGEFPEEPEIPEQMEMIAAKLRAETERLSDVEMARLEDPLKEAALAGSTSAQMLLAKSYLQSDPREAFKFSLLAADGGNSEAMLMVAEMYASGHGTNRNIETAFERYKQAADKGEPQALYAVGECYFYGNGVGRDVQQAIFYLTQSAAYNNVYAMDLLANIYRKGTGLREKNLAEAHRLLTAAASRGYLDAQGNLAVMIALGEVPGEPADPQRAAELLRDGAEQDNPHCMYLYGSAYQNGIGVPKDLQKGREWIIKAASAGNRSAQEWCRTNKVKYPEPPR